MARFILALLVIAPAVLAAEQRYGLPSSSSSQGAGALAAQYGTTTSGNEQHDKKQFGVNFNSDKGSSNTFTTTNAGLGVSGGKQQQQQVGGYIPQPYAPQPYIPQQYVPQPYVPPYNTYPQYSNYPYQYNPYVQQYPQILPPQGPGGVHAGANVGGPNGQVHAGAGVGAGGIRY